MVQVFREGFDIGVVGRVETSAVSVQDDVFEFMDVKMRARGEVAPVAGREAKSASSRFRAGKPLLPEGQRLSAAQIDQVLNHHRLKPIRPSVRVGGSG